MSDKRTATHERFERIVCWSVEPMEDFGAGFYSEEEANIFKARAEDLLNELFTELGDWEGMAGTTFALRVVPHAESC